jgi:hypothetical protein
MPTQTVDAQQPTTTTPEPIPCLMAQDEYTPCTEPAAVEQDYGPELTLRHAWCLEHALISARGRLSSGHPVTLRPIGGGR